VILIDSLTNVFIVFGELSFDQLTNRVENHGDVEPNHAGFEAHLVS